jgi:hypothetical protein
MSQLTYTQDPPVAIAGMPFDVAHTHDIVSRLAEVAIPAARFAVRGTAVDQAKLPTTSADVTDDDSWGVSLYDAAREPGAWPIGAAVPCFKRGRIWVVAEEAVTLGDAVFVRFAAGTFPDLGAFRKSADTATAVALPGAFWRSTTSGAGALAVLELYLPA